MSCFVCVLHSATSYFIVMMLYYRNWMADRIANETIALATVNPTTNIAIINKSYIRRQYGHSTHIQPPHTGLFVDFYS